MVNLARMRMLIGYERRLKFRKLQKFAKATRITAQITGMPRGSGNHSQTEAGAIDLVEVETAYQEVFDELKKMRAELEKLLPNLDNPDDIGIMRLRYIDGKDIKDIPETVCLSERAMFYHLASAERKLTKMYPGMVTR